MRVAAARRVRRLLKKETVADLAQRLGVPRSTVWRWSRELRLPRAALAARILVTLGA